MVHVCDLNTLFPACLLKMLRLCVGLIYDSHELSYGAYAEFFGPLMGCVARAIEGQCARHVDAAITVRPPTRYGIVEGEKICENVYKITGIKEKPARSASKLGVIAVYLFRESIYRFIRRTKPDAAGEIQLTDAIAHLIGNSGRAYGVELRADETRIDIGTPDSYWLASKETRRLGHRGHLSMKTVYLACLSGTVGMRTTHMSDVFPADAAYRVFLGGATRL